MQKRLPVLVALVTLLAAILACNLFVGGGEMSLGNVRMAFDSGGDNPTDVFSPTDVIFVVADLKNAPAGTVAEVKWIAVRIEGYEPGELIYEQSINDFTDNNFTGGIYFQLSNDSGWPVGEYRADVYLNGSFMGSAAFSVQ